MKLNFREIALLFSASQIVIWVILCFYFTFDIGYVIMANLWLICFILQIHFIALWEILRVLHLMLYKSSIDK
jgi:hypothetical protein